MKQWFVVQTHANAEAKAAWHLKNQGFETFLPLYWKRRRHARKTETVRTPLFPRYLFVAMDLASSRWRAVRSTIGVSGLVGVESRPTPLPDGIIDDLRGRTDDAGVVALANPPFKAGDRLRIMGGALADYVGIFKATDDRNRVTLLLEIVGRPVQVQIDGDSVAKAA